ncbi:MAG: class I SAM-dependent methyltransferase [Candidatus Nanopelagicales bacterium]
MNAPDRAEAAEINRSLWTLVNEQYTDGQADEQWASDGIHWGIFAIPESDVDVIGDVAGLDVVELGCGTAYFSAWLARRGARPVGVDLTPAQIASARRCQQTYGPEFPLVVADATAVPLPSDSFDLAISEYGASLWCDADGWIGEAARLLRPGGRLVFLTNSILVTLCVPDDEGPATGSLQRGQRDIDPIRWSDGGVEFHASHGDLIRTLRRHGFALEDLQELYAPPDAQRHSYYDIAEPGWAQKWPVEELWVARLSD